MHTPQRPTGAVFNRMISGAAYMPDAECVAQTKRIHAATVLAEEHYARGEHAQAMRGVEELIARAGEPLDDDGVAGVREDAIGLLGRLARHRQSSADLLYEAYETDVGGET